MIFAQLFFNCSLQLVPFALLYLYAFYSRLRFSKQVTALVSAAIETGTGFVFALTVTYIRARFPDIYKNLYSTGLLFIGFLILCLLGHFFTVKAAWNKRLFIFLFIMNEALLAAAISASLHVQSRPAILMLNIAALFPLWLLLKFYLLPMENELSEADSEYRQMKSQVDLVNKEYEKIQKNIEECRRMRHDLIHHMCTLRGFLIDGQTKKAEEYLIQYAGNARQFEILHVCEYPVVNILIGHYHSLAQKHHIHFMPRINITRKLVIHNSDISILLGNLLQNAVEACSHMRDNRPAIQLTMMCSGNMLVITVDNSFDGTIKQQNHQYLSTKPGHTGIGLKSVTDIAEKYSGGTEFSHDGNIFHASVMIRCVSNSSAHSSTLL